MNTNRYRIGRVFIDITNPELTRRSIAKAVADGTNGYICVSNLRTVVIARKDDEYRKVMDNSLMNIPDGTPLVWCGKLWGCKDANRSSGPDLFVKFLSEGDPRYKHFLLGDTDETLQKVKEKFPNANIVGTFSPPFVPLDQYDYESIARLIDDSGANIVWTSLRAPKQDILAARLAKHTHNKLFIGVGAAFRYSMGQYSLPPEWIRRCGLTGFWLLRNTSVGKELLWYLKHSYHLARIMSSIAIARLRGKKYYE